MGGALRRDHFGEGQAGREGTNLGVFVPKWRRLPCCEGAKIWVCLICHFNPL